MVHALSCPFCTVGMYLLQIQALKRLSAFTVNLTYNLEPCYTIILAFLIFGEGREINFFLSRHRPYPHKRAATDMESLG